MPRLFLAPFLLALVGACATPPPAPVAPPAPAAAPTEAEPEEDRGPPPPEVMRRLGELWARDSADGEKVELDLDPPPEGADPAAPPEPAAPPPPPDPAKVAPLLTALKPAERGHSLLLLGVHLEDVASYAPLYAAEGYPVDKRPGYRTIAVEITEDDVRVIADLPYLMVPGAKGFSYVGEAEAVINLGTYEPSNEFGFAMPHEYAASRIVSGDSPAALAQRIAAVKKRLLAEKEWGHSDLESLLAITPRATCSQFMQGQVTGGALGFYASTWMMMSRFGSLPLARKRLTDPELQSFGEHLDGERGLGAERKPDGSFDLDKPVDLWWRKMHWRKDVAMCFARHHGRVQITGSTTIPGNSARAFTVAFALGDAPQDLAPGNRMPLDFEKLDGAVEALQDVFVAPKDDAVVLLANGYLVALDGQGKELMTAEVGLLRPVMAEWASGKSAERWRAVVKRHSGKAKPAPKAQPAPKTKPAGKAKPPSKPSKPDQSSTKSP